MNNVTVMIISDSVHNMFVLLKVFFYKQFLAASRKTKNYRCFHEMIDFFTDK